MHLHKYIHLYTICYVYYSTNEGTPSLSVDTSIVGFGHSLLKWSPTL